MEEQPVRHKGVAIALAAVVGLGHVIALILGGLAAYQGMLYVTGQVCPVGAMNAHFLGLAALALDLPLLLGTVLLVVLARRQLSWWVRALLIAGVVAAILIPAGTLLWVAKARHEARMESERILRPYISELRQPAGTDAAHGVLVSLALMPPAAPADDEAPKAPPAATAGPAMFRADAGRSGYYGGALGKAAPSETHTKLVYASCTDGRVYAWDGATGEEVWSQDVERTILGCPAVAGGTVYVATLSRYDGIPVSRLQDGAVPCVAALDALTGAVRWKVQPARPVASSVVAAEGAVCFGTEDGSLCALSAGDGRPLWDTKVEDGPVGPCPAMADGVVFGGITNLCALDAKTGKILWKTGLGHAAAAGDTAIHGKAFAPLVADGMVYVTTSGSVLGSTPRYKEVVAVDAKTGRRVWAKMGTGASGAAAAADGILYFPSHDCRLYALNAATGEQLWTAALDEPEVREASASSDVVVGDGVVHVFCVRGILGLDPKTGKALWDARPLESLRPAGRERPLPAAAGGVLYAGSCQRNWVGTGLPMKAPCPLVAFEPRTGKVLWQAIGKGGFAGGCAVADAAGHREEGRRGG